MEHQWVMSPSDSVCISGILQREEDKKNIWTNCGLTCNKSGGNCKPKVSRSSTNPKHQDHEEYSYHQIAKSRLIGIKLHKTKDWKNILRTAKGQKKTVYNGRTKIRVTATYCRAQCKEDDSRTTLRYYKTKQKIVSLELSSTENIFQKQKQNKNILR